ncbi:polysaccharide biosynthesis/export family protein [Rhodobacter ferrooxidans]|uniref:Polysaccharide export protein n=1 Tax=Rhodobacter ferrooxidans TaxID=371731 RepID=C8S2T5_9RHOB|nr:polysaccharide biosynthesis/export family protein [Rhodobacter sp. SW2]EEW24761.1 polysaccharide export protein [Rhodobacter sp. SW2]
MRIWRTVALAFLALSACDTALTDFPVRSEKAQKELSELGTNVHIVQLTAANIAQFDIRRLPSAGRTDLPSGNGWNYRVGVGDILDIVVWEHPELTMPAGEGRNPTESGLRVQSDGTFFYPYVGQIAAKGLTPETIRANLKLKLAEFIPDPQIEVRVVGFNSQSVSVTGEVATPNRQPLNAQQLTLLQAVDAAGGLTEAANPRGVTIRRGDRVFNVDLQAFLERGVGSNNPTLVNGDVVNVPRAALAEAFMLGQVVTPSTIDLTQEEVNLTQALTRVGGLQEGKADARGVFVFRATDGGIVVYQLDASSPVAFLLGTKFSLLPQDVVYVTTAPIQKWNQVIDSVLPSVTAVRATQVVAGG